MYNTPDRITALASYTELCALCPNRRWHLVKINVSYEEFKHEREHIINLMVPNNTAMDLVRNFVCRAGSGKCQ